MTYLTCLTDLVSLKAAIVTGSVDTKNSCLFFEWTHSLKHDWSVKIRQQKNLQWCEIIDISAISATAVAFLGMT